MTRVSRSREVSGVGTGEEVDVRRVLRAERRTTLSASFDIVVTDKCATAKLAITPNIGHALSLEESTAIICRARARMISLVSIATIFDGSEVPAVLVGPTIRGPGLGFIFDGVASGGVSKLTTFSDDFEDTSVSVRRVSAVSLSFYERKNQIWN